MGLGSNFLTANELLYPNQSIVSASGLYRLTHQSDGNLVLYRDRNGTATPLWSSNTYGRASGVCIMQTDGNLVLYAPNNSPMWSSGTFGVPGARMMVQDDGNLVVVRGNEAPAWTSRTAEAQAPAPPTSLHSPRFAGDPILEACFTGAHRMLSGEQSPAVAKVQQALIDLGYAIPAGATGRFYENTSAAVVAFKTAHSLAPADPVVGQRTIRALDADIIAFDARRAQPPQPAPSLARIDTVKFILNAFIPRDVPGQTFPVTRGPHAGSTYVLGPPVPGVLMPRPPALNPFLFPQPLLLPSPANPNPAWLRPALLTNGRGFSTSDSRAVEHFKMHVDFTISFVDGTPRIADKALLGGRATQIDPTSGIEIQSAIASNGRMSLEVVNPAGIHPLLLMPSPRSFAVRLKLAVYLPLIPGAEVAGDIDVEGVFMIDPDGRSTIFTGMLDRFPAYEAFMVVNGNSTRPIFQILPDPGDSPLNLPGGPSRPVREMVGL